MIQNSEQENYHFYMKNYTATKTIPDLSDSSIDAIFRICHHMDGMYYY